jgi:Outer membrane cobalamin receptor protein
MHLNILKKSLKWGRYIFITCGVIGWFTHTGVAFELNRSDVGKKFIKERNCKLDGRDTVKQGVKADTLGEVMVSAVKSISAEKHSAPVYVMSKKRFTELGISELHKAVKTFSGVQIKDYGGIGGIKTVSVRSMGANHTSVSYDGVTLSNMQSGQVDIGRFNLDNIAYVSLVVGVQDDIFQTARMFASAGALSIKTNRPEFNGKNASVGVGLKVGSFGTYNPSLIYRQRLGKKWAMTFNADWLNSKGDYPFTLVNSSVVTHEKRYNSDVNRVTGEVNLFGDFGKNGEFLFKGNYLESQRGLPGSIILYNTNNNDRLWDKNGFLQASYENKFLGKWQIKGQLKYNYAWNKYREERAYYTDGVAVDIYTQKEYYSSVVAKYSVFKNVSVSVGEDFFVNTLDAQFEGFVYPTRYTSLTAVAAQYKSDRLTATASLLSTFITENVKIGEAADDRFRLSPAVSFSYKLFSDKDIRVRVMYQDIFRTPTFNDLYYAKIGNKNLKPELARQFNVGVTWGESLNSEVVERFSLQVDGFYNKVKDKIVAFPTLFIWRMLNVGEVEILGSDVNLGATFLLPKDFKLDIQASYSYQSALDVTDKNAKNYKHQIQYTPKNSGNITASLLNKWVNVGYIMQAVGDRYALPQNIKSNLIDGYIDHTISLNKTFRFNKCSLMLQAECANFTNEQYDIIQYYPMYGRNYKLTIKLKY